MLAGLVRQSRAVQAGTDLTMQRQPTLGNAAGGQLLAAGDLSADTAVMLDNAGVIQAGGAICASSATGAIHNQAAGTLYGTALATLQLGGALDNAGTIYGAQGLNWRARPGQQR